jgi:hypothetical protein
MCKKKRARNTTKLKCRFTCFRISVPRVVKDVHVVIEAAVGRSDGRRQADQNGHSDIGPESEPHFDAVKKANVATKNILHFFCIERN